MSLPEIKQWNTFQNPQDLRLIVATRVGDFACKIVKFPDVFCTYFPDAETDTHESITMPDVAFAGLRIRLSNGLGILGVFSPDDICEELDGFMELELVKKGTKLVLGVDWEMQSSGILDYIQVSSRGNRKKYFHEMILGKNDPAHYFDTSWRIIGEFAAAIACLRRDLYLSTGSLS